MELKDAKELALKLMAKHGLISEFRGWRFEFNNAKRSFGMCCGQTRKIFLSQHTVQLNDVKHVTNTILHEIAHALVGVEHGHDWVWQRMAKSIGCTGERCSSGGKGVKGVYVAVCPLCAKVFYMHRQPKLTLQRSCICLGGFNMRCLLKYEKNVGQSLAVSN